MSWRRNVRRLAGYGAALGGGYLVATWMMEEPASVSHACELHKVFFACWFLPYYNSQHRI